MKGRLKFDAENHVYSVGGQEILSVTQVLALCTMIDLKWYTEHGRSRGTATHVALQFDDEGDLDESTVDKEIWPRIEAWRQFKHDTKIKITHNEKPICHRGYRVAGTPDRIAVLNGRRAVFDIKTGAKEGWHAIQSAGYRLCYGEDIDRYGVYLRDTGKYSLIPHRESSDISTFRNAVGVAYWLKNNGRKA